MPAGCYIKTEEHKQQLSRALKKYYKTHDHWKKIQPPSKEKLTELYWSKGLTLQEVADIFNVSRETIWRWFKEYDIPRRTMAEAKKGKIPPNIDLLHTPEARRKATEKMKGRHLSLEHRKKISETLKKNPPNLGRCFSEDFKRKNSEALKRVWRRPGYKERMVGILARAVHKRPTKPEQQLISLLQENNLPYKYVGDGAVIIHGFCPDFINYNGAKKIIEIFGDYWHNRPNMPHYHTEEGRKAIFKEYGFETLVIWEHELREPDKVLQRVLEFDGSVTGREV